MLQKISWCVKSGHKQHLFQQYDFPFIKVWLIPIQKNTHWQWIMIEENPEYKMLDNIEDLSIRSF